MCASTLPTHLYNTDLKNPIHTFNIKNIPPGNRLADENPGLINWLFWTSPGCKWLQIGWKILKLFPKSAK